jgi:hypothetical protein
MYATHASHAVHGCTPRGLRDARNAQLNVRAAWLGVNTSTARLGNTEIMKKFTTLNH